MFPRQEDPLDEFRIIETWICMQSQQTNLRNYLIFALSHARSRWVDTNGIEFSILSSEWWSAENTGECNIIWKRFTGLGGLDNHWSPDSECHSMNQSPELLRRLLRAKDRMDGAPQEEWPVKRLATFVSARLIQTRPTHTWQGNSPDIIWSSRERRDASTGAFRKIAAPLDGNILRLRQAIKEVDW